MLWGQEGNKYEPGFVFGARPRLGSSRNGRQSRRPLGWDDSVRRLQDLLSHRVFRGRLACQSLILQRRRARHLDLVVVLELRERGVEFMPTPGAYYDMLPERLQKLGVGTIDGAPIL